MEQKIVVKFRFHDGKTVLFNTIKDLCEYNLYTILKEISKEFHVKVTRTDQDNLDFCYTIESESVDENKYVDLAIALIVTPFSDVIEQKFGDPISGKIHLLRTNRSIMESQNNFFEYLKDYPNLKSVEFYKTQSTPDQLVAVVHKVEFNRFVFDYALEAQTRTYYIDRSQTPQPISTETSSKAKGIARTVFNNESINLLEVLFIVILLFLFLYPLLKINDGIDIDKLIVIYSCVAILSLIFIGGLLLLTKWRYKIEQARVEFFKNNALEISSIQETKHLENEIELKQKIESLESDKERFRKKVGELESDKLAQTSKMNKLQQDIRELESKNCELQKNKTDTSNGVK